MSDENTASGAVPVLTPATALAAKPLKVASPILYGYENGEQRLFAVGEDWPAHLPETEALMANGNLKFAHEFDAPQVVADKLAAAEAEIEELKQRLTAAQLRGDLAEKRGAKAEKLADGK